MPGGAGGGRTTAAILTRAKERTFPLAVSPILPARTCGRLERRGSERGELKETNAKISKHIWSVFFAPCRPPFVAPSNAAAQLLLKGGSHLARQQARVRLVLARVLPHVDEHVRVRRGRLG